MQRFRRSYSTQIAATIVLLVLLLARWQGWSTTPGSTSGDARPEPTHAEVQRVVDGDTLLLRSNQRVRLQGIDTPETVAEDRPVEPWGPEATRFTQQFIRDAGNRVRLETDGEPVDHYDRWLRFVWDGDRLLNEELVREGLARAKLSYDYSQEKKDRLRRAQLDAQRAGRGIWSEAGR